MLTNRCKHCEDSTGGWKEKDLIYFIGNVNKNTLKCLTIVYGDCYCANDEIYEKLKDKIKTDIEKTKDIEFVLTNEVGKINKVDPLEITDLRIRSMWHIQNPKKVFSYIIDDCYDKDSKMNVFLIMKLDKYNSFNKKDRDLVENNHCLKIKNVKIKNPDNPNQLIEAKLIYYHMK